MLKLLVIVGAAGIFIWFVYPQFADGQTLVEGLRYWYDK
jgi:hypothetical protein